MLPLLVAAGGLLVASAILSGCDDEPSAPQEPVQVPPPPETSPSETPVDADPIASTQPEVGPPLLPVTPCGIKFQNMARFDAAVWEERMKFEDVLKIGDLTPLGQDRFSIYRGECPTPVRQPLRITQEDFPSESKPIRMATLSFMTCYQNTKCSEEKIQFAMPITESLRELFLVDENKDGTEDLLFKTDGKYAYVIHSQPLKP
ncbi:MAG TPA: hypothetical protein VFW62_08180 [bacterium]|nr:hypothetical protein [bacterium]